MPELRFGLQGPRYFPEGGPTLSAEDEAIIQGIVDAYTRSGNLPANEAEAYKKQLRDMAVAYKNGDDAAGEQFAREANGANQVLEKEKADTETPLGTRWTDPQSGKTFIYRDEPVYGGLLGDEVVGTRRVLVDEQTGTAVSAGGYASTGLRDLEEAAKRAEAAGDKELAAQYRARQQRILMGDQTATMSPGESARLAEDIRQFDLSFGLRQQEFGLQKQQAAIGAARAGNPLAYFGLTTGATPQEALNQVPLAPYQSQIRMGGPTGRMFVSGPGNETAPQGFRLPGVQTQGQMTPLQNAANLERNAVEFGVPEPEQEFMQQRLRRGFFGSGATSFGFGGTAT